VSERESRGGDDHEEGFEEGAGIDGAGDGRAHEQPEVYGQQEQLDQHQRRRRGGHLFGVAPSDVGEGDDVVDTRGQQYHERTDEDHRIRREEAAEHPHDDGDDGEVHRERGRHEPPVPERRPDPDERHLQEGDVQQDRQHTG